MPAVGTRFVLVGGRREVARAQRSRGERGGLYALRDGATLRHDQLADVRDTRILPYLHPDPSDATQLVVRLGSAATVATVRRDGEREKGR